MENEILQEVKKLSSGMQNLSTKVDTEIGKLSDKIDTEVGKLNDKTDGLFDYVQNLSIKVDKLEDKLEWQNIGLSTKISKETNKLSHDIQTLSRKTDALNTKIDGLTAKTDTLTAKVDKTEKILIDGFATIQDLFHTLQTDPATFYKLSVK